MKLYLGIYDDNDAPKDGILLTEFDYPSTSYLENRAVGWRLMNLICWLLRRFGLTDSNAADWSA
jgi:hypothetical protein